MATTAERRGHKYGAVKTTTRGIQFDSKAESDRYVELVMLQKAGEITGLQVQTPWPLGVNGTHVAEYVADFTYYTRSGRFVVEDVKGVRTPVYRLKAKMFAAQYGLTITETS